MGTDLIMVVALIRKLGLLSEKDAKNLYDELKFKNLSTDLNGCVTILTGIFDKHKIGVAPELSEITVGGKKISITK